AAFLDRCRIGEEHVTDELWTSLVARVGIRAAATGATVLRAGGLPLRSLLERALMPMRAVAVVADRYAQALRPRRADRRGAAWLARLVTEFTAALAVLSLFGLRFGVLTPVVWIVLAAMMLTFVALAPVTTLLTIVGIAVVGLAMDIPEIWLPDEAPAWVHQQLPLNRGIGTITILLALLLISSQTPMACGRHDG
ncbi:MAG: hypothetical protein ACR2G7_07755, partial [Acidimicrobiales bacterium]